MKTKNREWVLFSRCSSRCSFFCSRIIPAFPSRETHIKNVITTSRLSRLSSQRPTLQRFVPLSSPSWFPFSHLHMYTHTHTHTRTHARTRTRHTCRTYVNTNSFLRYKIVTALIQTHLVPNYSSVTQKTNISRLRENT